MPSRSNKKAKVRETKARQADNFLKEQNKFNDSLFLENAELLKTHLLRKIKANGKVKS